MPVKIEPLWEKLGILGNLNARKATIRELKTIYIPLGDNLKLQSSIQREKLKTAIRDHLEYFPEDVTSKRKNVAVQTLYDLFRAYRPLWPSVEELQKEMEEELKEDAETDSDEDEDSDEEEDEDEDEDDEDEGEDDEDDEESESDVYDAGEYEDYEMDECEDMEGEVVQEEKLQSLAQQALENLQGPPRSPGSTNSSNFEDDWKNAYPELDGPFAKFKWTSKLIVANAVVTVVDAKAPKNVFNLSLGRMLVIPEVPRWISPDRNWIDVAGLSLARIQPLVMLYDALRRGASIWWSPRPIDETGINSSKGQMLLRNDNDFATAVWYSLPRHLRGSQTADSKPSGVRESPRFTIILRERVKNATKTKIVNDSHLRSFIKDGREPAGSLEGFTAVISTEVDRVRAMIRNVLVPSRRDLSTSPDRYIKLEPKSEGDETEEETEEEGDEEEGTDSDSSCKATADNDSEVGSTSANDGSHASSSDSSDNSSDSSDNSSDGSDSSSDSSDSSSDSSDNSSDSSDSSSDSSEDERPRKRRRTR